MLQETYNLHFTKYGKKQKSQNKQTLYKINLMGMLIVFVLMVQLSRLSTESI
jgi:hypothetical protein